MVLIRTYALLRLFSSKPVALNPRQAWFGIAMLTLLTSRPVAPQRADVSAPKGHSMKHSVATGSRRSLLMGTSAFLTALNGTRPAKALNPYEESMKMELGPTYNGGIRRCPGTVNPNCVSTSSTTAAYGPAWRAAEAEPMRVAEVIEAAVKAVDADSYVADAKILADGSQYLRFGVAGLWGEDVLEFMVTPEVRKDEAGGALVLYRSMAGTVKWLWPLQQPVSDLDTQKKRLTALRQELGYRLIGCDLIECYNEGF